MNDEDKGHKDLLTDLKDLLAEAEAFQFHDFKNETYAFPKKELVDRLEAISLKVREGDYDNEIGDAKI